MNEAVNNSFITDPSELHYIWNVVNQVLDKSHELGSIQNFHSTLKEVSLSQGREVQMNLASHQNQLVGFNFSFKNDPHRITSTIPFKQQLELSQPQGDIVVRQAPQSNIDLAVKSNISLLTSRSELTVAPPLQVEGTRVSPTEAEDFIKSPALGNKWNSSLARIAAHLASRNEIDGLWLAGTTLKTATTLAQFKDTEKPPDIQLAGNAVIKRFEQVLPQQFDSLKNGGSSQPFNWKDPHSGKQYRFEFEAGTFSTEGQPLTKATLKAFEHSDSSRKTVFSASLIDAKRDRWLIEQCDFNTSQLQSLTACNRSNTSQKNISSFENSL